MKRFCPISPPHSLLEACQFHLSIGEKLSRVYHLLLETLQLFSAARDKGNQSYMVAFVHWGGGNHFLLAETFPTQTLRLN